MKPTMYWLLAICFITLSITTVTAQDDRHKAEVFAGYSYLNTDTGLDEDFDIDSRLGSHGFNLSVTGNFHRYAGLKFDFSRHTKSDSEAIGADKINAEFTTNQFLGGVQFKDNAKEGRTVKPFGHVLAGLANQKLSANGALSGTTFDVSESVNNFAMTLGAGVDVKVSDRVDIRVFQFDFNPIFFKEQDYGTFTIPGRTQNNFRISVGIVIH